jgi:tyrosyl-tRNA synthetase
MAVTSKVCRCLCVGALVGVACAPDFVAPEALTPGIEVDQRADLFAVGVTLYNMLTGRDVMEAYGLEPQVVLTTPLLLSWDGEKMSSSVGNNVPLTAAPEEMFGRTMRIPDSQLEEWWTLVAEQPVPAGEPMEAKLELARFIVARSHGEEAARAAEEHFNRVVRERRAPDEVPEHPLPAEDPVHLPALLADAFGLSRSEGRRLIAEGGVKLDGDPVSELDLPRERLSGAVLQAGKRRFVRLNEAA